MIFYIEIIKSYRLIFTPKLLYKVVKKSCISIFYLILNKIVIN